MMRPYLATITTLFLCCAPISSIYAANIVANPGFEDAPDGVNWTISAGSGTGICIGAGCETPNSGNKAAYINVDAGASGTISQTLTTISGTTYLVEGYLAKNNFVHSGSATVSFGSTVGITYDQTDVPFATASGYEYFSFTHLASSSSTDFVWAGSLGGGTFFLDDVSVSQVPIPAAAWLFGSALLGLGALKRKKA